MRDSRLLLLLLAMLGLLGNCAAVCALTSTPPAAAEGPTPAPIAQIESGTFDDIVGDGSKWLIEFYAPWCGHCTRFAPTYQQVAEKLHAQNAKAKRQSDMVMVGKVDGAAERALSSRFNIQGFPSFYLTSGWSVYKYDGDRTVEGLVAFATEGHVDKEPVPFMRSPFGPIGQMKGGMVKVGVWSVNSFDYLVNDRGYSQIAAAIVLGSAGMLLGTFLIIVIGLTMVKPKAD